MSGLRMTAITDLVVTVKDTVTDLNGNKLVESSSAPVAVDTVNPSTLVDEPFVSFDLIADADDGSTLTVSFTFDEDMDVTRDPSVEFDEAVASTLIQGRPQGSWEADGRTFKVEATVADKGIDVDAVTIDIEGAKDAAGNLQVDHTATVGLEVDTLNPAFTLEKAASVADDNIFSEFDVDTNPIVELSGLAPDIDLVEVFVIGANAADTVHADNIVGTENGVVKKTYDLGDAVAGVISVPIIKSDVNKLGQDGTEVFVRVTDVLGNTSVNNIGNLLIHTGTVLETEAGDVGLGEVVENGFTLGTKFIPHDGDVAGALSIIANPETGVTEVKGDKINFGAFSDDVYVDAGFGAVIVRDDDGMVGNAKLSLCH